MVFGIVDVIVGGLSTLVFVSLGVYLFKKYLNEEVLKGLTNKAFIYFAIFFLSQWSQLLPSLPSCSKYLFSSRG